MPLVTTTDLTNAKADCDTLTAVATGGLGTVTDRLGGTHKTLAQLAADVAAVSVPVCYGRVRGTDGVIVALAGLTATCVRNTTGNYTLTVPGLTANCIVVFSSLMLHGIASGQVSTGSLIVNTLYAPAGSTPSSADDNWSFVVYAL